MTSETIPEMNNSYRKQNADASSFVIVSDLIPDIMLDIRYYSTFNFVGARIEGYDEPIALLTIEAAEALKRVSAELASKGFRLKIFDAYRPQRAVDHFARWAADTEDVKMKDIFYPEIEKKDLIPTYIALQSPHSRGSTVDLTLFDVSTQKEVDMGGTFDFFSSVSSPDYSEKITEEQTESRNVLRNTMIKNGFIPDEDEWWHYTLANEPYPDTYFDFPVCRESVSGNKERNF